MRRVIQKDNENRKDYLIRVAISMLKENGYITDSIFYDEAECDAFCLAEDLRNEFDVES
jgi:hypothetical protein